MWTSRSTSTQRRCMRSNDDFFPLLRSAIAVGFPVAAIEMARSDLSLAWTALSSTSRYDDKAILSLDSSEKCQIVQENSLDWTKILFSGRI